MPESYSMELGGIAELVQVLDEAHEKIAADLAALEAGVQTLQKQWSGEAQHAYLTAQREWQVLLAHRHAVLVDAAGAPTRMVDGQLAARAAVAKLWA